MIDDVIPRSLRSFLFTLFSVISTIIVIMIATPTFGVVIIPLGIFYLLVQVSSFHFIFQEVDLLPAALLRGHVSSAEATGVHHPLTYLLTLPRDNHWSLHHQGLSQAGEVHARESVQSGLQPDRLLPKHLC